MRGHALFLHPIDLSSFESVRQFVHKVLEKYGPHKIHVLINNAGRITSGPSDDKANGQSLDLLYQSNMLGHYLLTAELMNRNAFAENDDARIVNLSSAFHHFCGGYELESVPFWKACAMYHQAPRGFHTYPPSKLAAILFTLGLNKRFAKTKRKIRSIAVNPGAVNSDVWRDFPRFMVLLLDLITPILNNEQGAKCSVAAAVSDQLDAAAIYLQPYPIVSSSNHPPFPTFEMLGPFRGPFVSKPRLPRTDGGDQAATAFWQASQEMTQAKWPQE